jgi:hypothetical protein
MPRSRGTEPNGQKQQKGRAKHKENNNNNFNEDGIVGTSIIVVLALWLAAFCALHSDNKCHAAPPIVAHVQQCAKL